MCIKSMAGKNTIPLIISIVTGLVIFSVIAVIAYFSLSSKKVEDVPVFVKLGEWSDWSTCPKESCSSTSQTRSRICTTREGALDKCSDHTLRETRPCEDLCKLRGTIISHENDLQLTITVTTTTNKDYKYNIPLGAKGEVSNLDIALPPKKEVKGISFHPGIITFKDAKLYAYGENLFPLKLGKFMVSMFAGPENSLRIDKDGKRSPYVIPEGLVQLNAAKDRITGLSSEATDEDIKKFNLVKKDGKFVWGGRVYSIYF